MLLTIVILLIIFALIGIFQNDYSLIIAIFKIVIGIAVFIIALLLLSNPSTFAYMMIISIIFFIWHFIKQKFNITQKTMEVKNENETTIIPDNENLSGFKQELSLNSSTIKQVDEMKKAESIKLAIENAKFDYDNIKRCLLDKVHNAEYEIINGRRLVTLKYYTYSLSKCLNVDEENAFINKDMFHQHGRYTHITTYTINDYNYYNKYLLEIKKLLKNDEINCSQILYSEKNLDCPIIHDIPYRTLGTYFRYDLILDCSISY